MIDTTDAGLEESVMINRSARSSTKHNSSNRKKSLPTHVSNNVSMHNIHAVPLVERILSARNISGRPLTAHNKKK